jgi:hypothetical protein
MVKQEYTGSRDLSYSKWHRTLPGYCYALDLDWIEFRNKNDKFPERIVAVIETKDYRARGIGVFQKKVMLMIGNALKVPAVFVKYNFDVNPPIFELEHLQSGKKKNMTEVQYKKWLSGLGYN